jgi:hypothetical protein
MTLTVNAIDKGIRMTSTFISTSLHEYLQNHHSTEDNDTLNFEAGEQAKKFMRE